MSNFPKTLSDGRYLLVQPLGEGGMASVFRGWDQRLQVWRAIKVLAPQYADKPRLRGRFENEAQTMANLEHKHIVRVYDVGSDGPFAYIVMELLEGGSLVDWLERHGAMPPRVAIDVTIEICEGLTAAHDKGVVHRDIKPHNILVTRDGVCRVTDFGIAQVSHSDQSLTKTGAVMGTWGYMAPEQRTNAKGVDARADVYATAATLYTLLTNKLPMDLFFADRDAEMLEGIPDALRTVIIQACDYDRNRRPATVKDLAKVLLAVRAELPPDPADTPPLAMPMRDAPPVPRPSAENTLAELQSPAKSLPLGGGGTLVSAESELGAPTMAPMVGATLDQPGPEQRVPLYRPGDPRQSERSFERAPEPRSSNLGMIVGAVALLVAIGLIVVVTSSTVATVMAMNARPTDAPPSHEAQVSHEPATATDAAGKPPPPQTPSSTSTVAKPDTTAAPTASDAPGSAPTAPPAPATEPAPTVTPTKPIAASETKPTKPVKPTNKPPVAATAPSTPIVEKHPATATVVTEPKLAPRQCVRVDPPQAASAGSDVVFRATLCVDDGTVPSLFYRSINGGGYTEAPMTKALGKFTTRVKLDGPTTAGIEYYVKAGPANQGSASSPFQLRSR
jgi:serine/threonine protein kinase